jgi:hypothetical protein
LPSAFAPFLTASRTSQSQEADILQLYQSLSQLGSYSVAMASPYSIFHSRTPTCNRQSSVNVYNANSDIWVCLD